MTPPPPDPHVTDRLNDYVEGLLPEAESQAVRAHLATCLVCKREEVGLREVLAALRAAPRTVEPGRDLWEGVAARIGIRDAGSGIRKTHAPRFPYRVSRIAAAIVVLIGVGILGTMLFPARGKGGKSRVPAPQAAEARFAGAAQELMVSFEAARPRLAPETVAAVERNLRIIDAAIRDAREALARDPGNHAVLQLYWSAYQQKLDLLNSAARAAAPI